MVLDSLSRVTSQGNFPGDEIAADDFRLGIPKSSIDGLHCNLNCAFPAPLRRRPAPCAHQSVKSRILAQSGTALYQP